MAKKTKKQVAIEKRIKTLKSEHKKLSRKKSVFEKNARREEKVKQRKLDALEKTIGRLQKKWDDLDNSYLPSSNASRKATDKLVTIEEKIRAQERMLRAITDPPPPPPSDAKREREAGEETEE